MIEVLTIKEGPETARNLQIKVVTGREVEEVANEILNKHLSEFGENKNSCKTALETVKRDLYFKLEMRKDPNDVFIYMLKDNNGKIIGILTGTTDPDGEKYINWIIIRESHKNNRIGTFLAQQVIMHMQRQRVFSVYTIPINKASQKIFTRLGFTEDECVTRREFN